MSRFFILGLLIFLVVYLLKRNWQPPQQKKPEAPPANEKMVKCANCGVYVPISEAIAVHGQFYCCDAHKPPQS